MQINCVKQMNNPYQEFDQFLELAENENLTFVFSNTTEAGIVLDTKDQFTEKPPRSFPGKLIGYFTTDTKHSMVIPPRYSHNAQ